MFSANSSQVSDDKLFVEDVFSTYLYTGTGSAQTITNGIDLAGKGGLVWIKSRSTTGANDVWDTSRGANNLLVTNETDGQGSGWSSYFGFGSSGFSLTGNEGSTYSPNRSGVTYASWTFREAPKFFDIVTYTGNGTAGRTIAHNLGIAPGMILVKRTDTSGDWRVYHRSRPNEYASLASTDAFYTASANRVFGDGTTVVAPTSTGFTVGDVASINGSGATYVAYVYAHDTTSDGIIQCGSYTTDGTGAATVTLGWEPQWVMAKRTDVGGSNWEIRDVMRGFSRTGAQTLASNSTSAEYDNTGIYFFPTATGFQDTGAIAANATYIYMAIRRGPMKTPTLGTSVFAPILQSPQSGGTLRTVGFPADFIVGTKISGGLNRLENTRLTGFANNSGASINTPGMFTNTTGAESNQYPLFYDVWNTTARDGDYLYLSNNVNWMFRRAPGFFDVVCYTSDGQLFAVSNHNLGVQPELIIVKRRNSTNNWGVMVRLGPGSWTTGNGGGGFIVNSTAATTQTTDYGPYFTSTTAQFGFVGGGSEGMQVAGGTYIAYLFASAPGVSKVGGYTGNGSSQTINCGFAAGARFVMIKRTDSTGDWYVWDTARGIVAGNDPHLSLNSVAVEVTTDDSVDTDSSGFVVNQDAATNINVSSATYIFLAIA